MADGRIASQEAPESPVEPRETLAHVLMPQREVQRLTEALAAKDDVIRGLTAALRTKDEEIRRLVGQGEDRSACCCDLHNAHCYDIEEICCRACPGVDESITNPPRPVPSEASQTDGPDGALVEEVGEAIVDTLDEMAPHSPSGCLGCGPLWNVATAYEAARAVLAHLAATGRLVVQGDERSEWGVRVTTTPSDGQPFDQECPSESFARHLVGKYAQHPSTWGLLRRTVRTWTAPDGSAGTLVGPWMEVEG